MDCGVRLPTGELMFCTGPWILYLNAQTKRRIGGVTDISVVFDANFPAFPEALLIGKGDRAGKLYVFSRGRYWRYNAPRPGQRSNVPLDRGYPKKIDDVWFETSGFRRSLSHGLDGAVTLPDGRMFFFSGDECIEHIWGQKQTGRPSRIEHVFPGMRPSPDYLFVADHNSTKDLLYVVQNDVAQLYDTRRQRRATSEAPNLADTWTGFAPLISRAHLAPLRARARAPLPSSWANVDVAETLGQTARSLINPLVIHQGNYPTCGQSAVIFCLAQYFPDLYVDYFVQALGQAGLPGTGVIKAHSRTFRARPQTYKERWRPEMEIRSNEWVLTALLRDDASQFMRVKNDGAEVRNGITTPNELRYQLKHLLPQTGTARVNRAYTPTMREAALKWAHDGLRRGGVAVHLVCSERIPGGGTSRGPNHWVTHLGGLNISHGRRPLRSSDDRYRLRVQSWGSDHAINWTGDQLKSVVKGYYGSVRWVP